MKTKSDEEERERERQGRRERERQSNRDNKAGKGRAVTEGVPSEGETKLDGISRTLGAGVHKIGFLCAPMCVRQRRSG